MKKKHNLHPKIVAHLQVSDPILFAVFERLQELKDVKARHAKEFFHALCSEIISQQLSGRVADVIFGRFEDLLPHKQITPEGVLKLTHEQMRGIGMSNAKAKYIRDLAEKVVNREVDLEKLPRLSNEEVIQELTKIKGIGKWTAEMFLMFTLGREDIFSHGDLGLKNAIKKIYQLENPTLAEVEAISIKWSPYRTYACRILWASLDVKEKK